MNDLMHPVVHMWAEVNNITDDANDQQRRRLHGTLWIFIDTQISQNV